MVKAQYVQKRFRIPQKLFDEMEADVEAYGTSIQRELVSRLIRGSRKAGATARHAGVSAGELEVAEKLTESLAAVLSNMKRGVGDLAVPELDPELDVDLDDEAEA